MKVLWFSNTPANSDEYFNRKLAGTGGWIKALDQAIQEKVELNIVFYHKQKCANFTYGKTKYYPIPKFRNYFDKLMKRVLNIVIDTEHLSMYLDLIEKIKPDIIHIHGTENPFGCIIGHTEAPVVVSIQGNITVYLHKYCTGIEDKFLNIKNLSFSDFKTILFPYSFRKSKNRFIKYQRREENNLKKCKYVIGRTDWDRRVSRVLAPKRNYFHNDEILRDGFYEHCWKPNRKKKVVLHTTNSNNFYKGFETLCQCLHELNKLQVDVEWRVAGIKPSDLIVKVVRQKLKNKFPDKNLKLLGSLTEQDLIQRLLEADIYITPSHIENSPNNLCEAMILGMPCIGTFAGGTGSLLKDGEEGILIQDGDPWSMAGAIIELIEDQDKANRIGNAARARAVPRHATDKIIDDLIELYKNILTFNS